MGEHKINGEMREDDPGQGRLRIGRSPAMIVAGVALFVALGGGGFAVASHLVVRSSDIVNGEVKTPDLATDAVTSAKVKNGEVKAHDLATDAVTNRNLRSFQFDEAKKNFPPGLHTRTHQCPGGAQRIAGGLKVLNTDEVRLVGSYPVADNKWDVQVANTSGADVVLTIVLTCLQ